METVAVLLAGGSGTRLYPASRSDRPKQFLSFGGDRSLLERTVDRVEFVDEVFVVTPARFVDQVESLVPGVRVLVEPAPLDTGPALVYATRRVQELVGECVVCCLPTDHFVGQGFRATIEEAVSVAASSGSLVTIGVEPDRVATGYGYIEPGDVMGDGVWSVAAFHEKPDRRVAATYVEEGWLWNAGMFVWEPSALLGAAEKSVLAPLVSGSVEAGFEAVEAVSIDYAVLEEASDVSVVAAGFEWDDVGSWDAVGRVFGESLAADSVRMDAPGTVVASDDAHVSVVGVEDLVVAAYDGRVLVCPRSASERVREVVDRLEGDEG